MTRLIIAFASLFFATAAIAADEPRKIDFTVAITDQDDEVMTECADSPPPVKPEECKAKRSVTLGAIAMRAVGAPEQGLSLDESSKRGQLALLIYKSKSAQLTAEEVALIKKQIAKFYSPMLVARSIPLLDPAAAK